MKKERRRLGLNFEIRDHNVETDDFEQFLTHVQHCLGRPIILVIDRYSVHRAASKRLSECIGRRPRRIAASDPGRAAIATINLQTDSTLIAIQIKSTVQ